MASAMSVRAPFARLALVLAPITLAAAPALAADPFTLIVVPDTQNYTDFADINTQYTPRLVGATPASRRGAAARISRARCCASTATQA